MINEIECNWIKDLAFEAEIDGHKIILDTEAGNRGPRPKPLLLLALAGCTGMDVISILCKMKVEVGSFRLKVSGDTTETHPKYYKTMHIQYIFKTLTGKN
jgi:putative redox protein